MGGCSALIGVCYTGHVVLSMSDQVPPRSLGSERTRGYDSREVDEAIGRGRVTRVR